MALAQFITIELLAEFNLALTVMQLLLFVSSLFLILLVLVQRGKGGGLTGALGGMGGQSAFGAKAGDAFTRITIGTAIVWLMLCMVTIAAYNPPPESGDAKKFTDTIGAGAEGEAEAGDADADDETTGSGAAGAEGGSGEAAADTGSADAEDADAATDTVPAGSGEETPASEDN